MIQKYVYGAPELEDERPEDEDKLWEQLQEEKWIIYWSETTRYAFPLTRDAAQHFIDAEKLKIKINGLKFRNF